jgi:NadR type nicotinamide-nucleotide adenylyltransferase
MINPEKKLIRIAITGPESTGKSTLAETLARHYHTLFVPEYARDYLEGRAGDYTFDDILAIAKGQLKLEDTLSENAQGLIFCDTELLVTRIWSLHRFGKSHEWIDNQLEKKRYDYYLLCNVDLPWEFDPLREHPHLRDFFFNWYYNELTSLKLPFSVISGSSQERINNAVEVINHLIMQQ